MQHIVDEGNKKISKPTAFLTCLTRLASVVRWIVSPRTYCKMAARPTQLTLFSLSGDSLLVLDARLHAHTQSDWPVCVCGGGS